MLHHIITRLRAHFADPPPPVPSCAGACGEFHRALCAMCRSRYTALRIVADAATLRWLDDTSRELIRRGAPDINARCDK